MNELKTCEDIEKRIGRELTIDEMCAVWIKVCDLKGNVTDEDVLAVVNA